MRYNRVELKTIQYELPPHVVTSAAIEERLTPLYETLRVRKGQLALLTGVQERRQWDAGEPVSKGAIAAGKKALANAQMDAAALDMVVYAAVCRENLEPATACAVADGLGVGPHTHLFDLSNACLGMMNGMVLVADAIESGRIRSGMVVACESSRQIMDLTMERMLSETTMESFTKGLATMTGGSGAAAMILAAPETGKPGHRLLGGVVRNAVSHHGLCTWGPDTGIPATAPMRMDTDAAGVLRHGVTLGEETFAAFLSELALTRQDIHKIICHQVGAAHRKTVLDAIGMPEEKDYATFPFLGNMGTVSLPITTAVAAEQGFLLPGDRVAMCGIGSGLNCMLMALDW